MSIGNHSWPTNAAITAHKGLEPTNAGISSVLNSTVASHFIKQRQRQHPKKKDSGAQTSFANAYRRVYFENVVYGRFMPPAKRKRQNSHF